MKWHMRVKAQFALMYLLRCANTKQQQRIDDPADPLQRVQSKLGDKGIVLHPFVWTDPGLDAGSQALQAYARV